MEAIRNFHEVTQQLLAFLRQEELDRDVQIEKIQHLLNQRGEFLKSIHPPFSKQEQELGEQLVELNQQVENLLQMKKLEVMKDMKQLQTQKKSNQTYTNPYESLAVDGMFLDKRK